MINIYFIVVGMMTFWKRDCDFEVETKDEARGWVTYYFIKEFKKI